MKRRRGPMPKRGWRTMLMMMPWKVREDFVVSSFGEFLLKLFACAWEPDWGYAVERFVCLKR